MQQNQNIPVVPSAAVVNIRKFKPKPQFTLSLTKKLYFTEQYNTFLALISSFILFKKSINISTAGPTCCSLDYKCHLSRFVLLITFPILKLNIYEDYKCIEKHNVNIVITTNISKFLLHF